MVGRAMRTVRTGNARAFDRGSLLRRGALAVAAGAGVGAFAGRAAADTIPDGDVAYLRLLLGAELLKADFQTRALATKQLDAPGKALLSRIRADDTAHAAALTALMNDAGQQPTTADDVDFSYPARTFSSRSSIVKLAEQLGTLTLGAYLGALENLQVPRLRLPVAQIAANEAQQLSALARALGRPAIGRPFAAALAIDVVSASLDRYES
jgi:Ferritin-like domain